MRTDTGQTRGNGVARKDLRDWITARKRHGLSHAHVQMARELGMNPTKLGKIDNHDQEPWKVPLPQFIEQLYLERFLRERPEIVLSIEERIRSVDAKKAAKRARKAASRNDPPRSGSASAAAEPPDPPQREPEGAGDGPSKARR